MIVKTGVEMSFLGYARKVARQNMGLSLSPFDAYIAMLGADTLALRMKQHSSNSLAPAGYLSGRSDLSSVSHPGLPGFRWNDRAVRYFEGWGGLLTFRAGS